MWSSYVTCAAKRSRRNPHSRPALLCICTTLCPFSRLVHCPPFYLVISYISRPNLTFSFLPPPAAQFRHLSTFSKTSPRPKSFRTPEVIFSSPRSPIFLSSTFPAPITYHKSSRTTSKVLLTSSLFPHPHFVYMVCASPLPCNFREKL